MATDGDVLFSIITPSTGKRPRALQAMVRSVEESARFAGLAPGQVEILVGFDGTRGTGPKTSLNLRAITFPAENDWGNGIRNMLLKISRGERVLFVDDDNALRPSALRVYMNHLNVEMVVARIDTQLAFDKPWLPESDKGSIIRPANIDPLCLCLSRRLVVDRCGGWNYTGYEADYRNILDYSRRSRSISVIDDLVAVYDFGRSLDASALSRRQSGLLDRMARERGVDMFSLVGQELAACSVS